MGLKQSKKVAYSDLNINVTLFDDTTGSLKTASHKKTEEKFLVRSVPRCVLSISDLERITKQRISFFEDIPKNLIIAEHVEDKDNDEDVLHFIMRDRRE